MHEDAIRREFEFQAGSFAASPATTSAQTLGSLIELVPEDGEATWLDLACGPGLLARAMSGRVGSMLGVDLTEAMLAEARRSAREEGIDNVSFVLGDATSVDLPDGSFDGAITRFSLHRIPVPLRVFREMARLVRPGGWVIIGDQTTDDDGGGAAWHQEIERLRDPTHWSSQTVSALRDMGAAAGLKLDEARLAPIEIDFDEWLGRGSGGPSAAALIDQLLRQRPAGAASFQVQDRGEGGRLLRQRLWLSRWRRP